MKIYDEAKLMFEWLAEELGEQTVLHLSGYRPAYLLSNHATKYEYLEKLYYLAKEKLQYVYLGNTQHSNIGNNTDCPNCGNIAIKRIGYSVSANQIDSKGNCRSCGYGPIVKN